MPIRYQLMAAWPARVVVCACKPGLCMCRCASLFSLQSTRPWAPLAGALHKACCGARRAVARGALHKACRGQGRPAQGVLCCTRMTSLFVDVGGAVVCTSMTPERRCSTGAGSRMRALCSPKCPARPRSSERRGWRLRSSRSLNGTGLGRGAECRVDSARSFQALPSDCGRACDGGGHLARPTVDRFRAQAIIGFFPSTSPWRGARSSSFVQFVKAGWCILRYCLGSTPPAGRSARRMKSFAL
jgi:hypothetical protein